MILDFEKKQLQRQRNKAVGLLVVAVIATLALIAFYGAIFCIGSSIIHKFW
jgi:hypothetical protein